MESIDKAVNLAKYEDKSIAPETRFGCVLYLDHVSIDHRGTSIIKEAHIMVKRGEAVGLVGPSGIGKSTLLKALCGVLGPEWVIHWQDSKVFEQPIPQSEATWQSLRGKRLAYMPQDALASFVPRRTLENQIKEICQAIGLSWTAGLERIQDLAKSLDLSLDFLKLYPQELSGGMIQRVALLVALLPKPELLLADEPTAALDLERQIALVELLKRVTKETGCALLFVTHQKELLTHLGGRIYEIREGVLNLVNNHQGALSLDGSSVNSNPVNSSSVNHRGESLAVDTNRSVSRWGKPLAKDTNEVGAAPLLEFKHVSITYGKGEKHFQAVSDVSLQIQSGEWVGLVGPSGAGKSSLFKIACGLLQQYEGSAYLDGHDVRSISLAQLGTIVQPIFQQPQSAFNPKKTLRWSLEAARSSRRDIFHKDKSDEKCCVPTSSHYILDAKERDMSIEEAALESVLLPVPYGDKYMSQLSGGEGQRAAIARALISNPKLLLCDEITSALDRQTALEIIAYLKYIKESSHIGGLIITHDLDFVRALCHRMYVIGQGRIVESGAVEELLTKPKSDILKRLMEAFRYVKRAPTK
ncbi:ABC transporter ATP-binding protein [uncultured Veillonella sp.]|uniref:ABC transporter ATP-binding protein n=1 Tax=uncultured Veillonella sp. TaxID=159268 RepID=UPI0025D903A1|nr:ATP-binding cassette domain-containing protein [uncultured Veillonella sp.]